MFVKHTCDVKCLYTYFILFLQCIVQSYLQWLQDSDYNPNCTLCDNPLAGQDTVRLVCYGKFTYRSYLIVLIIKTTNHSSGSNRFFY